METTDAISSVVHSKFEHAFDANHNRKFERRGHDGDKGDNYIYDSADRLVTFERGVAAVNVGAPGSGPAYPKKDFQLDGVQNWRKVTTNGVAATLAINAVNAYASIVTGGITENPLHDPDGNMTSPSGTGSPLITLKYDFQNRLREITNGTGSVFHDYDASGRRIRTYTSGTVPGCPPWVEYVHDGWEVIEEFDGSNNLMRRFVMGSELDEPLRMDTFSFWQNPGTYYFQRSTLGHVVALSNSTGAVVERYTYDAYGMPQFEDAVNAPKAVTYSDYGNPYLFTGRRYEPWIRNLFEFRHRFLDPAMGRFLQRDPIGAWGDPTGFGSAFAAMGGNPPNSTDASGLSVGHWGMARAQHAYRELEAGAEAVTDFSLAFADDFFLAGAVNTLSGGKLTESEAGGAGVTTSEVIGWISVVKGAATKGIKWSIKAFFTPTTITPQKPSQLVGLSYQKHLDDLNSDFGLPSHNGGKPSPSHHPAPQQHHDQLPPKTREAEVTQGTVKVPYDFHVWIHSKWKYNEQWMANLRSACGKKGVRRASPADIMIANTRTMLAAMQAYYKENTVVKK